MATALRRPAPAIVSAGGIVVVVMLVLGVADYNATRWMGPVLAIGTAITVLAGITLLPALLAAAGARAHERRGRRCGRGSARSSAAGPAALATAVLALLVAGALGNLRDNGTLDFASSSATPPESVAGLRSMQEKFLPGQAGPVDVVLDAERSPTRSRRSTPAVALRVDLDGQPRRRPRADPRHARRSDPFTRRDRGQIPRLRDVRARREGRRRRSSAARAPRS